MQMNSLFAIYDRKAQYYLPPFTARTDADAHRVFIEAVMSSNTPISQYPADFDLLRIGSIDLETGVLTPQSPPYPLVNGLVALTEAHRERSMYQTVLSTVEQPQASPEAG